MLEYKPFIDALEQWDGESRQEYKSAHSYSADSLPACLDVPKFLEDFKERFPDSEPPYLGGLRDLEVREVGDGPVKINEYDGFESLYAHDDDEWL